MDDVIEGSECLEFFPGFLLDLGTSLLLLVTMLVTFFLMKSNWMEIQRLEMSLIVLFLLQFRIVVLHLQFGNLNLLLTPDLTLLFLW